MSTARKAVLHEIFADAGWKCPQILHAMDQISDVYYDRVSQIRLDGWYKGGAMLIGDAAACVSLKAGEGAGLAMTEAYVLAGELKCAGHDYQAAYRRYEQLMRPFVEGKQKLARCASPGKRVMRFADRVRCPLFALLVCSAVVTSSFASDAWAVRPVPVTANRVTIDDAFWSPKLKTWRAVTIKDCLDKFERDGAFRNFDHVARGELDAPHGGPPWYDGLIYEVIRARPT